MFDWSPVLLWLLAVLGFPVSLIIGLVGFRPKEPLTRRSLWLPGFHLLFVILWGGFVYQTVFLDGALVRAAMDGKIEAVQALLARGADPRSTWEDGRSAMEWASTNGHSEVAHLLMEARPSLFLPLFFLVTSTLAVGFVYWTVRRPVLRDPVNA